MIKVRNMVRSTLICICLLLLLVYFPAMSFGGGKTASFKEMVRLMTENSSLPEYCQVRLAEREIITVRQQSLPPKFIKLRDKWSRKIGGSWVCFHHYSWGISNFQKAMMMKYDDPWRKKEIKGAIGEFEFQKRCVEKYGGGYFPLWKELLQYQYQGYMMIGDLANAQKIIHEMKIRSKKGKK